MHIIERRDKKYVAVYKYNDIIPEISTSFFGVFHNKIHNKIFVLKKGSSLKCLATALAREFFF